MRLFLCALGLALIMEGLPCFAFPEKMKVLLVRIQDTSEGALRALGFTALLTGLILVYFGKG
jgi:uncharacterized protein YjeT (DUF2065 family)